MKFRKKPVVIEAWQFTFDAAQRPEPSWVRNALNKPWHELGSLAFWPEGDPHVEGEWNKRPHIAIKTLEGTINATPGDWIIRGVKGELYPCKPDIFDATYEPAEVA